MLEFIIRNLLVVLFLAFSPITILPQIKIHKSISMEDGLVSNRIISMFEDSRGYLWFGTDNGVSRWDGTNFKNYQVRDGLAAAQVLDIKEGNDGSIYFATYGKGITYLKNDSLYILNDENGLTSNWMTKILVRLNGDILFAGEYGKISVFRSGIIEDWQVNNSFMGGSVWSIYETNDSILYLSAQNNLYQYSDSTFKHYQIKVTENSTIRENTIYTIEHDENKNILVGTLNGAYKLSNNKFREA